MPPDNAALVPVGGDVAFPEDGPTSGTDITRSSKDTFILAEPGTYLVQFVVSVTEAGQLVLTLEGSELPYTVTGRNIEAAQIVGLTMITTTEEDSELTVRNPAGNATSLTISPSSGGAQPVSAHLVILRLA